MRLAVLGAKGLVGQRIVRNLGDYYEITAISRDQIDLSKKVKQFEILSGVETLIFCAQPSAYISGKSKKYRSEFFQINGLILKEIVQKNEKIKQIIYLSSGGIYEEAKEPISEKSAIKKKYSMNEYFLSKYETEQYLNTLKTEKTIAILRLFTVYGKEAKPDRLFPRLEGALREGKQIEISMNGGDYLRPTNVNDVVNNIHKILQDRISGVYNIAGPSILNMNAIIEKMGDYLGVRPVITENDALPKFLAPDNHLMVRKLIAPKYEFDGNWAI